MFSAYCMAAGAQVLLDPGAIEGLLTSGGELAMEYRCSCGERGIWRAGRGLPLSLLERELARR